MQPRRLKIWRFLYGLAHRFLKRRFRLTAESCAERGPCLIISNHATNWDPLLLAVSFPDTPIRFVASEHIFRHGLVSRVLEKLLAPIPRRKGAGGADTVRMCLRALKDGETVCIFAEGDASWDGLSHEVFPATGKLARMAGVTLVTYRLEGGYLTWPRWAKRRRVGKMRGAVVGVYTPEELRAKKPEEITALINRDIFEDAWARQRREHVRYRGEDRAEGIERGFFLCPQCGRIGTVYGVGNRIRCGCGLSLLYTQEGFLQPDEPFETLAEWERWQQERLRAMRFEPGQTLFSDEGVLLTELGQRHGGQRLGVFCLRQLPDALCCGERRFVLKEILNMAMVKANILLLTTETGYYELRAKRACCLRKYLAVWQKSREQ